MRAVSQDTIRSLWYQEVTNSRAFSRGTFQAASVGNLSVIQLLNPAGSPRTVIVYRIMASVGARGRVQYGNRNSAITTLLGTGFNLNVGAAAAQATIRTATPATNVITNLYADVLQPADESLDYLREWAIALSAGEGWLVQSQAANVDVSATFWWIEV